jgi:hypothetical protein
MSKAKIGILVIATSLLGMQCGLACAADDGGESVEPPRVGRRVVCGARGSGSEGMMVRGIARKNERSSAVGGDGAGGTMGRVDVITGAVADGECRLLGSIPGGGPDAAGGAGDSAGAGAGAGADAGGEVVRVGSVEALYAAVEEVGDGGTILIADGRYRLAGPIILREKRDVTIRSASSEAERVVLTGRGWDSGDSHDDILRIGHCDGVTISDLTFADCRSYGVKVEAENGPRNVHILRCRFRDIGVRAIKGSAGQDPEVRAVRGSVRHCDFENTKVPPANWLFGGDYISAIDMMALEDWTFSDNVFRNIKGRNGGGRAAIFIWVRSRGVTVERNRMVGCDRGIAFGNPGRSTANVAGEAPAYVADSVIRNNFIAGGPDCGIELWYAEGIKVFHNSIWRPERNWSRGIRVGTGTARTEIVNNLVHGEIRLEGGEAEVHHNLAGRLDGYFVDPASGDLALTADATGAFDAGVPLAEVTEDIRGKRREVPPELGAWEER